MEAAPGPILADRYLVAEEIGRGGMGTVYRATDLRTGGTVAVKVLHPNVAGDPVYRERLRREALTAAALSSPRVVRVVDLDEDAGTPFLVMEYVAGETLQARLRREGRLPPAAALSIVLEIAQALEDAHAHGIVHRDLKPQNVKLVDGQVKVLDFGIARVEGLSGLTLPGDVLGTPAYSAPEAARGAADVRADIYALGVILYALLEGHAPFRGPTAQAVQRLHETAPPPATAHAPPAALPVLRRCLAKDPRERFQTPADLVAALRTAGRGLPGGAGAARTAPGPLSQTVDLPPPARPRTLQATLPAGRALPAPLSSFVGRKREAAALQRLLRGERGAPGARLVTLTGAGGAGKTRLALHVAAGVVGDYRDGARLVELAPLAEATHVPHAVAAALGVREAPGRALADTLADAVRPMRLLLVLDNCEHLVAACAALADALLRACPYLTILATSREALGVPGETRWPVPALSVPAAGSMPAAHVAASEAVRLFAERAAALSPGFAVTEKNAGAVAELCRRLDGLPLAIELAAARVRLLSVEQIAARLDGRLRLLTSGSRSAPQHQRTLRASMDWSYDLLAEPERRLLGRLAVFAGGWTLEAAEAVCAADGTPPPPADRPGAPDDVLEALAGLVDKSLVVAGEGELGDGERRYRLLETVRQYAWEKLAAGGDVAATRDRHAIYFLGLAEAAEAALIGPEQAGWLVRLEADHENLRAALAWALDQGANGASELGLRLAAGLWRFWVTRGYLTEGQQWLDRVLAADGGGAGPSWRAKALNAAGNLARMRGEPGAAAARHEESLALRRALGDVRGVAASLTNLGNVALDGGDFGRAARHYDESLAYYREAGDRWGEALALNNLAVAVREHGDPQRATALHEESLALRRALGDRRGIAEALDNLGRVALDQEDWGRATALLRESLTLWRELGERPSVPMTLEDLGRAAAAGGDLERAARLWGAAETLRATLGAPMAPHRRRGHAAAAGAARARLGDAGFARAQALGNAMAIDEAIAYALSGEEPA